MNAKKISISKNAAWLMVLQFFNMVAPLLALPYIATKLSVDEFGIVMVSMGIVTTAQVITDYGFGLSGVYRIAKNKCDEKYCNKLIEKIITAKIILTSVAVAVIALIAIWSEYKNYQSTILYGLFAVIFQGINWVWLYQGLGIIKPYAIYGVISKLVYIAAVYLALEIFPSPDMVMLAYSASAAFFSLACTKKIKQLGYKFSPSSLCAGLSEIKSGWEYFVSRISVAAYNSAVPAILGLTTLSGAGMYAVADQGYRAGQAITSSIAQIVYPQMVSERDFKLFVNCLKIGLLTIASSVLILDLFAGTVVDYLFGSGYNDVEYIVWVMSITLLVNFVAVMFGYPGLALVNNIQWANRSAILGALTFFAIISPSYISNSLSPIYMAVGVLITEATVAVIRSVAFIAKYNGDLTS